MMSVVGFKAEESGHSPVESPDSLHATSWAKILDIVSEGPILGLVSGLQSVYFDGTPVQNPDGTLNFPETVIDTRLGTQDQSYIAGMPSVESETLIASDLKFSQPWTRAITNLSLSAARVRLSVTSLIQQLDNGDRVGWRVDYVIQLSTDGGAFQDVLTAAFDGKTVSTYPRSHRIELPRATQGWSIRVRRLTPDSTSTTISGNVRVEALTEVIDAKLRYPMSALVFSKLNAAYFSNRLPARAFDIYGRIIAVPSNYDPATRAYLGVWDGSFKLAWTNNPAWVFMDLALNERYGLGQYITAAQVDKWGLYRIAQYCDELVSDGKGGKEPRFTCNLCLQSQKAAIDAMQDLASIFRGMAFVASGSVYASADMPTDDVYTFNAATVINGKFSYSGSKRKTRYTVALVSWNDPADFYRQKVEYVEDREGIVRYGIQSTPVTAFGCTSQGQAQRAGQWILLTSRLERDTVRFSVGLEGTLPLPGKIVKVYDRKRAGVMNDGRVRSASGRTVTLDRPPLAQAGDTLTINMPSGGSATRTIKLVSDSVVTVTADWPEVIAEEAGWHIETSELTAPTYRVLSIKENDGIEFEISAVQHVPEKFEMIDSGTRIDTRPIVVVPPSVQAAPTGITLSTYSAISQGIANTTLVIEWTPPPNGVAYDVGWRRDNGDWVSLPRTGLARVEIPGIYAGLFTVRVRAINAVGTASGYAYSAATQLQGKTTPPPVVTSLTTKSLPLGIEVDWGYPAGALDVAQAELWYGTSPSRDVSTRAGAYAYPVSSHTLLGMAAATELFFWVRLIDRSGNVGAFYPDGAGVRGTSSVNSSEVLSYLANGIGKEQLTKELLTPIEAIPGIEQGLIDANEAIVNEATARRDADAELSTRVEGVVAKFDPQMAGSTTDMAGDAASMAGAWSEQSARAEGDLALAKQIETVSARLRTADATLSAAVRDESQARVDATSAIASKVTTVEASVGDVSASVQQVSQAQAALDGKVSAYYSVKMQISSNGVIYGAGMTIGIDKDGDTVQRRVLFETDSFGIFNSTSNGIAIPFIIQNGDTIINSALIGKATIGAAKLVDWLESDAKNEQGLPLLRLNFRTGEIQLNGAAGSGGRMTLTNQLIQVFDANGGLRWRSGIWQS